jgi:uncharacterized protein (DUF433 family)
MAAALRPSLQFCGSRRLATLARWFCWGENSSFPLLPSVQCQIDLITVDPEILNGAPVFKGTRVPLKTFFDYLENDYTLEAFLECFPSVTREMARGILQRSEAVLLASS